MISIIFLLSNTGSKGTFLLIPSGSQMSFTVKIGHIWKPYGKSVLKHIHFYRGIRGLVYILEIYKIIYLPIHIKKIMLLNGNFFNSWFLSKIIFSIFPV